MNVIELFSCSGGMAEGLRRAGIHVTTAIDFDENACASYQKNLGERPIRMDVRDLLRLAWAPAARIDLFVADPPCFPPGTMVATSRGRQPIETIREGDIVLTHAGRWRRRDELIGADALPVVVPVGDLARSRVRPPREAPPHAGTHGVFLTERNRGCFGDSSAFLPREPTSKARWPRRSIASAVRPRTTRARGPMSARTL
jgi:C-5 cytosine-specific DNA methylase/Hint domain